MFIHTCFCTAQVLMASCGVRTLRHETWTAAITCCRGFARLPCSLWMHQTEDFRSAKWSIDKLTGFAHFYKNAKNWCSRRWEAWLFAAGPHWFRPQQSRNDPLRTGGRTLCAAVGCRTSPPPERFRHCPFARRVRSCDTDKASQLKQKKTSFLFSAEWNVLSLGRRQIEIALGIFQTPLRQGWFQSELEGVEAEAVLVHA